MAAFVKYQKGVEALVEAINAGTDSWAISLSNTAPNVSTHATLADATDLPTSGGYTAGGNSCAITTATQTGGVYKLVLANPATWTASGGGFTFRYCILRDATTNNLIGYWDYGSSVVMNGANADTFSIALDATNGVFTVS